MWDFLIQNHSKEYADSIKDVKSGSGIIPRMEYDISLSTPLASIVALAR